MMAKADFAKHIFNIFEREREMKTVWNAETASKAFIETVQAAKRGGFGESDAAELISAMAAGSNAQLIVEAWSRGGDVATSTGLSIASRHTGGRHVCVVPDELSTLEYVEATRGAGVSTEIIVGEAEEAMEGLPGVDFLVVDCRLKDAAKVLGSAKMSRRGAVLVCTNVRSRSLPGFRLLGMLGSETRVVKSSYLPVGNGVEIAQVGPARGPRNRSRWINYIDRATGEEHVFRR